MTILIYEVRQKEEHIIQPHCCIKFQFNSILHQSSWNNELPSKPFSSESLSLASENPANKKELKHHVIHPFPSVPTVPKCRNNNKKNIVTVSGFFGETNDGAALPVSHQEKKRKRLETSRLFSHNWHRED